MDILELSTYNTTQVNNNSSWINTFSPIKINTGDEIGLKSCFIDLKTIQNSYGNIDIQEDINLSLTFGYYQNYISDLKVKTSPKDIPPDAEPHIARNSDKTLLKNTVNITLEAGNYTPDVIGEILTRKLTEIDQLNLNAIITNPTFLISSNDPLFVDINSQDAPTVARQIQEWQMTVVPPSPEIIQKYAVLTKVTINYLDQTPGQPDTQSTFDTEILSLNVATGLILTKDSLSIGVGSVYSDIVLQLKEDEIINMYSSDNAYSYVNEEPTFIGSSQVSLVYNFENSNRFQWQYLHTPYYTGSNNVESSGFDLAGGVMKVVDSLSGVFFTDLQPVSFWRDTLGFNLDTMLVKQNGNLLQTPLKKGVNITSNFFGLDNLFDKSKFMEVPTTKLYTESSATVPIRSFENIGTTQDSGFYLIQISGLNTNYTQDDKNRHNIMGIISREYNNNGFVSDWGSGSLRYVNTGEPYLLSSLEVTILDPKTKKAVNGLGESNSVFLEVIHNTK